MRRRVHVAGPDAVVRLPLPQHTVTKDALDLVSQPRVPEVVRGEVRGALDNAREVAEGGQSPRVGLLVGRVHAPAVGHVVTVVHHTDNVHLTMNHGCGEGRADDHDHAAARVVVVIAGVVDAAASVILILLLLLLRLLDSLCQNQCCLTQNRYAAAAAAAGVLTITLVLGTFPGSS